MDVDSRFIDCFALLWDVQSAYALLKILANVYKRFMVSELILNLAICPVKSVITEGIGENNFN